MKARITDLLSARHAIKDAAAFLANAHYPEPAPEAMTAPMKALVEQLVEQLDEAIRAVRARRDAHKGGTP